MAEDYKDHTALFLACRPLLQDGWTLAGIARVLNITYQNFHHAYKGTPGRRYGRDREMELVRTLIIMYANGVRPATPVSNRPQLLEEQKNVLMDLQADGWSLRGIGRRLRIPAPTVRGYRYGHRLASRGRREQLQALSGQPGPSTMLTLILRAMKRRADNGVFTLPAQEIAKDTRYHVVNVRRAMKELAKQKKLLLVQPQRTPGQPNVWYVRGSEDA